ncbi:capZ-interacting protein [Thamnophis elegans]|uniref:capZ-interacting protein n=1 Tax=Thamnophis elegans TaxID=35005 RepID=UPI0013781B0C|nr:capZ-interacting protein [Thamnophis elegans]
MGEEILPKTITHLHNREDKPSETKMVVEKSTAPSVAQLAGKFQQQSSNSGKEVPVPKPARRKPPCSLPLHTNKMELGQNGEVKPSPNAPRPIRIKPKSSPLIEKLQANLALAPTSMLPGASPKSPGLKAMVSPFNSPPVTPVSPKTHLSIPDESPVSFEQPPEGTHLQFYNKVRTRGSIKRRPPSRRFRKSQSEYGDDLDLGGTVLPQENGSQTEEKEEVDVFMDNNKCMKSSSAPVDGIDHQKKKNQVASNEKLPSDLQSSGTEKEVDTEKVTKFKESQEDKTQKNLSEERPSKTVNNEKGKNTDTDTTEDTKRKPQNCNASNMENTYKEKREEKINGSEDSHHESSIQDTGTSQPTANMKLF